jgi:hypothetical protein
MQRVVKAEGAFLLYESDRILLIKIPESKQSPEMSESWLLVSFLMDLCPTANKY